MKTDAEVDLYSSDSYANGHPLEQYAQIRRTEGLYWHEEPEGPGFWVVGRYADTQTVSRGTDTFSSWYGTFMWDIDESLLTMMREFMLFMDPPHHSFYRRLAAPAFTPRRSQQYQSTIQDLVNLLIDGVQDRDEFCLVEDLVGNLPLFFIADVLGFPREDSLTLYEQIRLVAAAPDTVTAEERADAVAALYAYGVELGRAKRDKPGDDLCSILVNSEVDGEKISEQKFSAFFMLLVDAGADTTRNALGAGLMQLMADRDQWRDLREGSEKLLASAADEVLRWASPAVHMRRTATRDVEIAGQRIQAGEKVVLFYGSANNDTAVFDRPERFDITRPKNPHVAFGAAGPHVCIGAHFARLEIREMLRGILNRLDGLEQCGDAHWHPSTYIIGPESIPVRQR
jgi:cytochrome P450